MEEFLISPEDGRVLIALEEAASLREAARRLRCDPAGLFRRVQKLARQFALVRKVRGRWVPTERGQAVMAWTHESMLSQKRLLAGQRFVRLGSTSWLSERVLIPALPRLRARVGTITRVEFTVPEGSFEKSLLRGANDFIVACHPPEDPAIMHRRICREQWLAVVSKRLAGSRAGAKALERLPYVHHSRASLDGFQLASESAHDGLLVMADNLTGVRAAVIAGLGWSFVPKILVAEELRAGMLQQMEIKRAQDEAMDRRICLWWLRESEQANALAGSLTSWLKTAFEEI